MRILISGGSGFIGNALSAALVSGSHTCLQLVRRAPDGEHERRWDPAAGELEPAAMEGVDAVIHLAGEPIAGGRWSRRRMQRILDSRRLGTRLIAETMSRAQTPPKVLLCASAIGYYGHRPGETLAETSAAGDGFLAEVCQVWEDACEPARQRGIRVVNLRLGIVLSTRGGALEQMLGPFRLGLGGRLGSGRQIMSWIHLADVVGAVLHLLEDASVEGPVNLVAPAPRSNREFTAALGDALGRPTVLPAPAFALRVALGKMAKPLLLADQRVLPRKLQDSGYRFSFPTLESALEQLLD